MKNCEIKLQLVPRSKKMLYSNSFVCSLHTSVSGITVDAVIVDNLNVIHVVVVAEAHLIAL